MPDLSSVSALGGNLGFPAATTAAYVGADDGKVAGVEGEGGDGGGVAVFSHVNMHALVGCDTSVGVLAGVHVAAGTRAACLQRTRGYMEGGGDFDEVDGEGGVDDVEDGELFTSIIAPSNWGNISGVEGSFLLFAALVLTATGGVAGAGTAAGEMDTVAGVESVAGSSVGLCVEHKAEACSFSSHAICLCRCLRFCPSLACLAPVCAASGTAVGSLE